MLAWDLILVGALIQVITGREPFAGANQAAFVTLAGVSVLWAWYWLRLRPNWRAGTVVAGLGLFVMLCTIAIGTPPGSADGLFVFATVILAAGLPWRNALLAVVAISALILGLDWLKGAPGAGLGQGANNLLVGLMAGGGRLFVVSYLQLHAAKEEIARLAVAEERLRFSRDLHDLLGHSLAVVVLKSEVVARKVPEGEARDEVKEIATVARRALEQVR